MSEALSYIFRCSTEEGLKLLVEFGLVKGEGMHINAKLRNGGREKAGRARKGGQGLMLI